MLKRTEIFLICIFFVCLTNGTEIVRYVDPDASGTEDGESWVNAYQTLDEWEAAEEQDLTNGAGDTMVVHCRSSSGTADVNSCVIQGWTTNEGNDITIIGDDFPVDGVPDETKYRMTISNDKCIRDTEGYVNIINIQFIVTVSDTGTGYGISVDTVDAGGSNIRIDSCIIKGICSGTGVAAGVAAADLDAAVTIYNCVIYGFASGSDTGFNGVYCYGEPVNIYNCTIYGNVRGINDQGGTVNAYNCAIGINTDDISGTITMDYIVSDDDHSGDCTNYHAFPTNGTGDWSLDFDTPGSDFTLLSTAANLIDDGNADLFDEDDDIIGTARPQGGGWDIGAFEYDAGNGSYIPSFMHHIKIHRR